MYPVINDNSGKSKIFPIINDNSGDRKQNIPIFLFKL